MRLKAHMNVAKINPYVAATALQFRQIQVVIVEIKRILYTNEFGHE